jgi:hypothetical protein
MARAAFSLVLGRWTDGLLEVGGNHFGAAMR